MVVTDAITGGRPVGDCRRRHCVEEEGRRNSRSTGCSRWSATASLWDSAPPPTRPDTTRRSDNGKVSTHFAQASYSGDGAVLRLLDAPPRPLLEQIKAGATGARYATSSPAPASRSRSCKPPDLHFDEQYNKQSDYDKAEGRSRLVGHYAWKLLSTRQAARSARWSARACSVAGDALAQDWRVADAADAAAEALAEIEAAFKGQAKQRRARQGGRGRPRDEIENIESRIEEGAGGVSRVAEVPRLARAVGR